VRARAPRFSTSYDQQPVGSLKYVASLPVRTAEPVGLLRSLSLILRCVMSPYFGNDDRTHSLLQICFICFFSCEQWRLPACIGAPYQTIRTTSTAAAVLYMVNLNFAACGRENIFEYRGIIVGKYIVPCLFSLLVDSSRVRRKGRQRV
jgi:hypothetical protein